MKSHSSWSGDPLQNQRKLREIKEECPKDDDNSGADIEEATDDTMLTSASSF